HAPPAARTYPRSLHDALPISSTTQTALIYIHNVTLCLSSITLLCYSLCEISGQKNEVAGSTGVVRTTSGRGAIVSIAPPPEYARDRKSTRLNSSHAKLSYPVF